MIGRPLSAGGDHGARRHPRVEGQVAARFPAALGASPTVRLARQGQAPVTLTDGDGGDATFAVVNGTVAVTVTGEDLVTAGLSEHVVEQLTGITVGDPALPVVVPTDRPVPVGVGGAA